MIFLWKGVQCRRKDRWHPEHSGRGEQWQVKTSWRHFGGKISGVTSSHGWAWPPERWKQTHHLVFPPVQNFLMLWVSQNTWNNVPTQISLKWAVQYGRQIPCYEPTVYTVNDGVRSLLPKIEFKLMTSSMAVIVQISPIWRPSVKKLAVILSAQGVTYF